MGDRIKSVRIEGFRSIEDLTVELTGLQVLVGENGAGKSTIVESFEILRRLAAQPPFLREFYAWHGDARDLARNATLPIRLTVLAEISKMLVRYRVEIQPNPQGGYASFASESAWATGSDGVERELFRRTDGELRTQDPNKPVGTMGQPIRISPEAGVLPSLGLGAGALLEGLIGLLQNIEVMPSFATRPPWANATDNQQPFDTSIAPMRSSTQVEPVTKLQREGRNLTSVFQQLLNGRERAAVIDDVRAGLGSEVMTLNTRSPSPGRLQLVVSFETRDVPVSQLSEGQLVYLALVALKHLRRTTSVLLVEEPELHLHPSLVVRVGWLLEQLALMSPVLVTTHSDALLDALTDPAESVRVVALDPTKGTRVLRLSSERLAAWRAEFANAGVGELRREYAFSDLLVEQ